MAEKQLQWTFPQRTVNFLRLELLAVGILAVLIFIVTWVQGESAFFSLIMGLLFVGIYFLVSFVIQRIRSAEEQYKASGTHLQVTRKTRFSTKKEKVHLKKIHHHKLDRAFLGGYALSHKGKHLLFFNNTNELEKFDKHVKKHGKKK